MVVFSVPQCPKCKILKLILQNKNVPFTVCEDLDELDKEGITSVPVLKLDTGEHIYQDEAIKYAQSITKEDT